MRYTLSILFIFILSCCIAQEKKLFVQTHQIVFGELPSVTVEIYELDSIRLSLGSAEQGSTFLGLVANRLVEFSKNSMISLTVVDEEGIPVIFDSLDELIEYMIERMYNHTSQKRILIDYDKSMPGVHEQTTDRIEYLFLKN